MAAQPMPGRVEKAARALRILRGVDPAPVTGLRHEGVWQLLVAAVLSAQTTDAAVNSVTPELFHRWPKAENLAAADVSEVERVIQSIGFYRQKAHAIIKLNQQLVERSGGRIPEDLQTLMELHGVGRKTASLVRAVGHELPAMTVDTHVARVARRLGFSAQEQAQGIEDDLRDLYEPRDWEAIAIRLMRLGRETCTATAPKCDACPLLEQCATAQDLL